jgi:hypothetical protein
MMKLWPLNQEHTASSVFTHQKRSEKKNKNYLYFISDTDRAMQARTARADEWTRDVSSHARNTKA